MTAIEQSIPDQQAGMKKEFTATRRFITLADAQLCYSTAINRLLNINHWHELSPAKEGGFRVTSRNGKPLERKARLHDYIRIGPPAPANPDGHGYDWVQVVAQKFTTGKRKEQYLLTLRPCPAPGEEHTAHFFTRVSTSSFLLTREGKLVTAAYYGRNELPNSDTAGPLETIRNMVVAAGAMLGLSNVLWSPLVHNLIADGAKLRGG